MAAVPTPTIDDPAPGNRTRAFFAPSVEPTGGVRTRLGTGPLAHKPEDDENNALFGHTLAAFRHLLRYGGRGGITSNLFTASYYVNAGEYYDAVATYAPVVASGAMTTSGAASGGSAAGGSGTSGQYSATMGPSKTTSKSNSYDYYDYGYYDYDYYDPGTGLYDDRRESIDANQRARSYTANDTNATAAQNYTARTALNADNPNERRAILAGLPPDQYEAVLDAMDAMTRTEGTTIVDEYAHRQHLAGEDYGKYGRGARTPQESTPQQPSPVMAAFDAAAVAVTERVQNWTGLDISGAMTTARGVVEAGVDAYESGVGAYESVTTAAGNLYTGGLNAASAAYNAGLGWLGLAPNTPPAETSDLSAMTPEERRAELADRRAAAELRAAGINPDQPAETPVETPAETLAETAEAPAEAAPEERRAALADARAAAELRATGIDPNRPADSAVTPTGMPVVTADLAPTRPGAIIIPGTIPQVQVMDDGSRWETWTQPDGSTIMRTTEASGDVYLSRKTDTSFVEQQPDGTVFVNSFPQGDVTARTMFRPGGEVTVSTPEGTREYGADGRLVSHTPRTPAVTPGDAVPADANPTGVGPDGVLRIGVTPFNRNIPVAADEAAVTPAETPVETAAETPGEEATPVVLPSGPRSRSRAYRTALTPEEAKPAETIVAERTAARGVTPAGADAAVTPTAATPADAATATPAGADQAAVTPAAETPAEENPAVTPAVTPVTAVTPAVVPTAVTPRVAAGGRMTGPV